MRSQGDMFKIQKDFQKNSYSLSNNIQIFGKYINIGAVLEATVETLLPYTF